MSRRPSVALAASALLLVGASLAAATPVELRVIDETLWLELQEKGKEIDASLGDWLLRNDRVLAVIARPGEDRDVNLSTRQAGGALIDLTLLDHPSDQLTAFLPGGLERPLELRGLAVDGRALAPEELPAEGLTGHSVEIVLTTAASANPWSEVRYSLAQGERQLRIDSRFENRARRSVELELVDWLRVDDSGDGLAVERAPDGRAPLHWAYDRWFGQAYGVTVDGRELEIDTLSVWKSPAAVRYLDPRGTVTAPALVELAPGESLALRRWLTVGRTLFDVHELHARLVGEKRLQRTVRVEDAAGDPIADADVTVLVGDEEWAWGRSEADGSVAIVWPEAAGHAARLRVTAPGRDVREAILEPGAEPLRVVLADPARLEVTVVDGDGRPIPAKVEVQGRRRTPDPFFGPDSGEEAVHNVLYTANGRMRRDLPPGDYALLASHGPEYDAVQREVVLERGRTERVEIRLRRSVDTRGWISADFHSHASPSGDNTASQRGRVLNLLAEHVEFAPATEHNRISSYRRHLEELDADGRLATAPGIELTGRPLPLNHHNAFPLRYRPGWQDGGGPRTSVDPSAQLRRLAAWDDGAEKLLQQNHPDIAQLVFDRDADGERDPGFVEAVELMEAIEVHPLEAVFWRPLGSEERPATRRANTLHGWLQMLNAGLRVTGVVNTDAHYNWHGSGWLRNWVASPTDEPSEIDPLDVVRAVEAGQVVMSNGPFLEVEVRADGRSALPGGDLRAGDGRVEVAVRVQCPDWLSVDRVDVWVNGSPEAGRVLRRSEGAAGFASGVVQFEGTVPLELERDAHLIVAAVGEDSRLGPVVGPARLFDRPVAIANPVFVDVDGGGFEADGSPLGAPLTVPPGREESD